MLFCDAQMLMVFGIVLIYVWVGQRENKTGRKFDMSSY